MTTTNASSTGPSSSGRTDGFAHTRWSIVLATRAAEPSQAATALEQLCQTYWMPLYAYVRRRGYSAEDAQDLTQEFFAHLLARDALRTVSPEKGKFRAFLLASLKHFLANEWDRRQAQKRGGGIQNLSLDVAAAESRYKQVEAQAQSDALSPDKLFDRQWALTVLDLALTRLEAEYNTPEKQKLFAALKGALTADLTTGGYADVAKSLAMTEGAIKVAVHRLRKRYREVLKAEIAQTVADPQQVGEELKALFAAF
jgi:RNA polymerase sigma-70 factor (ECF subfamily)